MIYVITDGEFYKVGIAQNLKQRLSGLQNGNPRPLEVVCTFDGDRDLEGRIHNTLPHRRPYGREWFRHSGALQRVIDIVRDHHQGRAGVEWALDRLDEERAARIAATKADMAILKPAVETRMAAFVKRLVEQYGITAVAKVADCHWNTIQRSSTGRTSLSTVSFARLSALDPVSAKEVLGGFPSENILDIETAKAMLEALTAWIGAVERKRLRVVA